MIPQKLKPGDEVRVISPSNSLALVPQELREIVNQRFEEMGLKLTFSKNSEEINMFNTSSIKSRVDDLHEAFMDKEVKAILATTGGYNANQILNYIDYRLLKENPKIFCGCSDITILTNSIYAKTNLVTYEGPGLSKFGMKYGFDYTMEYFKKCLFADQPFEVEASESWSDDNWRKNQEERVFIKNEGYIAVNEGEVEGTIIGGNLCTFNLLQGTEYMPSLNNAILFIEDETSGDNYPVELDRKLQSLIHQSDFNKVNGIVIGRGKKSANITKEKLDFIIKTKKELDNITIAYGFDFGHTTPQLTLPIGGRARLSIEGNEVKLTIIEH